MRRLIGFVTALPADSRTLAVDPSMPWTVERELLALTVEELSRLTRENPLEVDRPVAADPDTGAGVPVQRTTRHQPSTPEKPREGISKTPTGGTVANGMGAMLQYAAQSGHISPAVGSSA